MSATFTGTPFDLSGRVGIVKGAVFGSQAAAAQSDASRFVTGAVLRANGGATMPW